MDHDSYSFRSCMSHYRIQLYPCEEEMEAEEVKSQPRSRPKTPVSFEGDHGDHGGSEAERAMLAARKKHDEDEDQRIRDYEEQRRIQREKEEEEIRLLKEKQERRRKEREEEDRMLAERKMKDDERRKEEEEERRKRVEDEKRKKEEEKKRRHQAAGLFNTDAGSKPNYVVEKRDKNLEKFDKFGNIVKAKAEMGLTKEQQEDAKRRVLAEISKPLYLDGMDISKLRQKIKELHHRICRLEADKYDLEKRHERQEYDLKELNERQRQINRNKALKKGLDPDAMNSRFPPKVAVSSKYDRQIDRRSFYERKQIYEKENSRPHFPNVPPPPEELQKVIAPPKHAAEADFEELASYRRPHLEVDEEPGEEEEEED